MAGNFTKAPKVTAFEETIPGLKYNQIIVQKNIDIKSKCSHHLETIIGKAYVAYLPGESGMVVGLSKLNRIADYYSRRPQVQERLTVQIHNALNDAIPDNRGIAVYITSKHGCVSCRGIQHDSTMDTIEISGVFEHNPSAKDEFLFAINHKVS
jgi:GTP cyclohydrolase I